MGCDIHDWAEVRKGGKWEVVGEVFDNPYFIPDSPVRPKKIEHPLDVRHYRIYRVLANVRGLAEAGPMSDRRGLPPDVTEQVARESENWGVNGHDHGWVDLYEMITYDYSKETEFLLDYWKRDAVSEERHEMDTRLEQYTVPALFALITTEPLAVAMFEQSRTRYGKAGDSVSLAVLQDWLQEHDLPSLRDVRMVFWFDN